MDTRADTPDRGPNDLATAAERLHAEVDALAGPLHVLHADRLQCRRGCTSCCVDDLTVFEVEAELIRRHHAELLATAEPHPPGACAFLDAEGACRIYAHRPYVCRTQGLPLRWLDEDEHGDFIELRDICPLNDPESAPPLESLDEFTCWTIGPVEEKLSTMQRLVDGGVGLRVRLRELFEDNTRT